MAINFTKSLDELVMAIPREQRLALAEHIYKDIHDTKEYEKFTERNRKLEGGVEAERDMTKAKTTVANHTPYELLQNIPDVPPELDKPEQVGVDKQKLEQSARLLLEAIGEDPDRDGLRDTPKRFAKYYSEIMCGHFQRPEDYVTDFENDGDYDGAVVVRGMPFYTVCEHHLAPFIGHWDVAYKPGDRIVGLSKLVRIARVFQKRPQVQERLTRQIACAINDILKPEWVVVRMNAEHFCMSTRGVRTPGSMTETLSGHGDFPKDIFNV